MPQTSVPFKVGDHVVYPSQGAGKIIGMVERPVLGVAQPFFEIELMKGSMSVLVPVAQAERVGLRRITVAKLIPELLEGLHPPDLELPAGWTPRHRKEQLLIAEGDIFQVAKLVGTLQRRDNEKALSATERKIMDDARHMVTTEIAMSLEIGLEEAAKKINAALDG
jgi:CarD family transcriptional regulator